MPQQFFAAALVIAWAVVTYYCLRRPAHQPRLAVPDTDKEKVLIGWASQSGQAKMLADEAAGKLCERYSVQLLELNQISETMLQQTDKALFIVSTYGQGEPPDNAVRFNRQVINNPKTPSLDGMAAAVLALGDKSYPDYCAFGLRLAERLQELGAHLWQPAVTVDNMRSADLDTWDTLLADQFLVESSHAEHFTSWQLVCRQHLNPGSPGNRLFHLGLRLLGDQHEHWHVGDLVDIRLPDGDLRTYSIASVPDDNRVDLVVRQVWDEAGNPGKGSNWLTERIDGGSVIPLRLHANPAVHPVPAHTPLVLIGNGSGIAGLRAMLKQRSTQPGSRQWLIFGERDSLYDRPFEDETRKLKQAGRLEREDRVFSRDPLNAHYVQDVLKANRERVKSWLMSGAAIYVCGSKCGMGEGVDQALRSIAGDQVIELMQQQKRYLRDLY